MKYKLRREPLARWRQREGRTYAWLARRIGLAPRTLVGQMSGHNGVSLEVALQLEVHLGVPVSELVEAIND